MIDSGQPTGIPATAGNGFPEPVWGNGEVAGVAQEENIEEGRARLVGPGFIGAAIMRRKRLWLVLGAVGLLIGGAMFVKSHPAYQVTVSILMVNDQSIDQPTAMQTDALLATNPDFAQEVVQKLGLNETATNFIKAYNATAASNQLLAITVTAPTATDATNWANVLATSYLNYRAAMLQEQLSQTRAAADQQVTNAQDAFNKLNAQITQVSGESSSDTQKQELKTLQNKRIEASDYLTSMQQTAGGNEATMQLTVESIISGSRILQSTSPTLAHSRKKTGLEYVGGGLFGGIVLGMGIIAVGAVTSSRLRRRDEVAEALGAPVRLSVTTSGDGGRLSRARGRDRDVNRVIGYLRSCFPTGPHGAGALAVVAVDDPKFVASLVRRLAVVCANDGIRVMVADLSGGALARLLGEGKPGIHTVTAEQARFVLVVPDPDNLLPRGPLRRDASNGISAAYSGADILITLATLDPARGADCLGTWATNAVAVVTAGLSTDEKVRSIGEMIRGAGVRAMSGVLLGADTQDESLGLL